MSNTRDELTIKAELKSLSAYICGLRRGWITSGTLTKRTRGYSLRPNVNFIYDGDPNFVYSIPVEHHDEEVWSSSASIDQLIETEIISSAHYATVIASLHPAGNETQILRSFCFALVYQSHSRNQPFDEDKLIDTASRDLLDADRDYRVLMFLSGITLKDDKVLINDRLTLRRPAKEDVLEYIADDNVHFAHAMSTYMHFSCICEARHRTTAPYILQRWTDQLVTALGLYQLGSVFAQRIDVFCDSLSMLSNFSSRGPLGIAQGKQYALGQPDAPTLAHFINTLAPHFPTAYEPDSDPQYLYTALSWYHDSLRTSRPLEGLIASCVACLEALFLHDINNEEIAYRLKQRVSLLLGRFGFAPQNVRSILADAYSVRSKYVHGGKTKGKFTKKFPRTTLEKLFDQVADMARLAFLINFQIETSPVPKEKELYMLLEDAAIDDRARHLLDELCKQVAFISSVRIPHQLDERPS